MVNDDGLGYLSNQAINWINAMEDVQLEIIDAGLLESLKQAEKFAKICDLNVGSVTKINDLEAAEPIQGPNTELTEAHRDIDKLEEEQQIDKYRCGKLERWLE
ncbi:hypothetical protein K440DRAFT_646670 [Wilcoxina mikolae CBS 423.85]|nr:hypothetical protein K440DRAFT_646670 [Wilcoxina mikolae CBS 423.85]